jgi:hypothetical protein
LAKKENTNFNVLGFANREGPQKYHICSMLIFDLSFYFLKNTTNSNIFGKCGNIFAKTLLNFPVLQLTKKLNSRKEGKGEGDSREEKGTQADMGNGVIIPPLPFDMDAVEKLLMDTAVRPLDSK